MFPVESSGILGPSRCRFPRGERKRRMVSVGIPSQGEGIDRYVNKGIGIIRGRSRGGGGSGLEGLG